MTMEMRMVVLIKEIKEEETLEMKEARETLVMTEYKEIMVTEDNKILKQNLKMILISLL